MRSMLRRARRFAAIQYQHPPHEPDSGPWPRAKRRKQRRPRDERPGGEPQHHPCGTIRTHMQTGEGTEASAPIGTPFRTSVKRNLRPRGGLDRRGSCTSRFQTLDRQRARPPHRRLREFAGRTVSAAGESKALVHSLAEFAGQTPLESNPAEIAFRHASTYPVRPMA